MPSKTYSLLKQFQKPPLSLKQFMLRTEILKLYRGFMRLGRMMDVPPSPPDEASSNTSNGNDCKVSSPRKPLHPLQLEWISWVRSEFRLREATNDEEVIKMMLTQGKRQLQEMERTISLANNRNLNTSSHSHDKNSSCSNSKSKNETKNISG